MNDPAQDAPPPREPDPEAPVAEAREAPTTDENPDQASALPRSPASPPPPTVAARGDRLAGLRAVILLAIAVAALTKFIVLLVNPWTKDLLEHNRLALPTRHVVIYFVLGSAGTAAALGGLAVLGKRGRYVSTVRKLAFIMAPAIVLPFLPVFWLRTAYDHGDMATMLAGVALLLEWLLRMSMAGHDWPGQLAAWWRARRVAPAATRTRAFLGKHGPLLLVIGGSTLYAAYIGLHTVYAHQRFLTAGYDLGQYDNLFYNLLNGEWFRVYPLKFTSNWSSLRGHADLGALFLLPFYALRPGAETLLVMQATVVASGAVALYLFGARHLPRRWAVVVAFAYLLYAPLQGAVFYDFHFQPVAAALILWAIHFIAARRYVAYWVFFLIAMSCREDIPIGLVVLGIFLWLSGFSPRTGFFSALVAGAYFALMRFWIMPSLGPWWFSNIYKQLYPEGDQSFGGVVKTVVSNPSYMIKTLLTREKLRYTLQILAPLVFLPLRRPYLWLSLVVGFLTTLMTTMYAPTTEISFQYSGHFVAYVFPAAVLALASYRNEPLKLRAAGTSLAMASVLACLCWGVLNPTRTIHGGFQDIALVPPSADDMRRNRVVEALARRVPHNESIAVAEPELPHVTTRPNIYSLRDGLHDATYLLFSVYNPSKGRAGAHRGEEAIAAGAYVEVERKHDIVLAKKKAAPTE